MTDLPHIPFTKEGYQKIQAEQADLLAKRAQILIRLQAAREMGDLSENGAYKAARFELGDTDRRLRDLQYQLRFGYIAKKPDSSYIDFGSQVSLELNGVKKTYLIVNQYESNPTQNKLSQDSPLGQLLMGKKAGDTVTLTLPNSVQTCLIKSVT